MSHKEESLLENIKTELQPDSSIVKLEVKSDGREPNNDDIESHYDEYKNINIKPEEIIIKDEIQTHANTAGSLTGRQYTPLYTSQYTCKLCEEFKTSRKGRKGGMIKHLKLHAGEKPIIIKCHLCDFTTSRGEDLKIHGKMHTSKEQFVCDLCGYQTCKKSSLSSHMPTHIQSEFTCYQCEFKTDSKRTIWFHAKIHKTPETAETN